MTKIKKRDLNKLRVVLGISIAVMVMFGLGAYFSFASAGPISIGEISSISIALILSLVAVYYVWEKKKDVDAGLPYDDEMSKKIMHKAGYYAFFASIYSALGISMFEDVLSGAFGMPQMTVSAATGLMILISSVVFFGSVFYLRRKGDV